MTSSRIAIVWLRQDLRLRDNTALNYAVSQGYAVIPVYILDDVNAGEWKMGGASRWWLHYSLSSLNTDMQGKLVFRTGAADKILPLLINETKAEAVFWNRCYEPWRIQRDKNIKQKLKENGHTVETFKDFVLWEPWEVLKADGTPYKVFTPYYRRGCLSKPVPTEPTKKIKIEFAPFKNYGCLEDLMLMPSIAWYKAMEKTWIPGEAGAKKTFEKFLNNGLKGYATLRNRPDLENVSRLSPYLHFGEISIRDVWHTARAAGIAKNLEKDIDVFCSELGWREFSNYLLFHFPQLPREPLQERFKKFPWEKNNQALLAWQRGETGIPIIDAGMRELWQTGYMHNRVRMITASFLIKNLLLHWHEGENWFWDCLVDANLANNSASWQWVAGCGADAAPYFRIFNPVTQGEKFDPECAYIKRFVPELKDISSQEIHNSYGLKIKNYPSPIVDLSKTRTRALEAFSGIKSR